LVCCGCGGRHRVWCVAYTICWSCDSWGRGSMDIESLGLVVFFVTSKSV
jgi:hypothetical protein